MTPNRDTFDGANTTDISTTQPNIYDENILTKKFYIGVLQGYQYVPINCYLACF